MSIVFVVDVVVGDEAEPDIDYDIDHDYEGARRPPFSTKVEAEGAPYTDNGHDYDIDVPWGRSQGFQLIARRDLWGKDRACPVAAGARCKAIA